MPGYKYASWLFAASHARDRYRLFVCPSDRRHNPPNTAGSLPPGLSKPLTAWPPILLTNRVMSPDNGVGYSGSSSFVRLPDGVVVLMTAGPSAWRCKTGRLFERFQIMDCRRQTWLERRCPNEEHRDGHDAAIDTRHPGACCLHRSAIQLARNRTYRHALNRWTVGETVYLVGIPADEKSRQTCPQSRDHPTLRDDHFSSSTPSTARFKTTGNSGAPIVDSLGRLAAVNVGHLNDQTIPGKMQLTCIETSEILPVVKIPPNVKAVGKTVGH